MSKQTQAPKTAKAELVKPEAVPAVQSPIARKIAVYADAAKALESGKGKTFEAAKALYPAQPLNALNSVMEAVKAAPEYAELDKAAKKTLQNYASVFRQAAERDINYNGMSHAELQKALVEAKKAEKAAKDAEATEEEKAEAAADAFMEKLASVVKMGREQMTFEQFMETAMTEWKAQEADAKQAK